MIQLAIECSGTHGSVAISRQNELIRCDRLPSTQNSVQSLAIHIANLLDVAAQKPAFLSVTNGPGSFTGLRVGLATAKMIAWAWKIPIVPIDTLEVISEQMRAGISEIASTNCDSSSFQSVTLIPAINAFRGQVFSAAWQFLMDGTIIRFRESQVVDAREWMSQPLRSLKTKCNPEVNSPRLDTRLAQNCPVYVGGPATKLYRPQVQTAPSGPLKIIEEIEPDARAVARIGWRRFQDGFSVSADQLAANYIRRSAAEEKLPRNGLANNSN
jgi:tRNA threonylcarbamoyladenosine biosynthesis protein TsaB